MMKFPIINRLFPSYKWKVAAVIIGGVIVGGFSTMPIYPALI